MHDVVATRERSATGLGMEPVNGGRRTGPLDDFDGSDRSEPSVAILAIWFGIASIALIVAVAALFYGVPQRGHPDVAFTASEAMPITTASIGAGSAARRTATTSADAPFDMTDGGRSDIAGSFSAGSFSDDAATTLGLSRAIGETTALRQTVAQLRQQMDGLSERLSSLESKLDRMTGSVAQPREPMFVDKPDVAVTPSASLPGSAAGGASASPQGRAPTGFGLELGSFDNVAAVRTSWRQLLQSYPNLFSGLDGLVSVRDRDGGTELRLIAGPFRSAADANEHCSKLEAAGIGCKPTFFLGQQLSLR